MLPVMPLSLSAVAVLPPRDHHSSGGDSSRCRWLCRQGDGLRIWDDGGMLLDEV